MKTFLYSPGTNCPLWNDWTSANIAPQTLRLVLSPEASRSVLDCAEKAITQNDKRFFYDFSNSFCYLYLQSSMPGTIAFGAFGQYYPESYLQACLGTTNIATTTTTTTTFTTTTATAITTTTIVTTKYVKSPVTNIPTTPSPANRVSSSRIYVILMCN